jgi:hypothetical protein
MNRPVPLPVRFGNRHKRTLYAVFALLWVSGVLWLGFHYYLRTPGEFGEVAHPLEKWWLRLHGLMGFASLVAVGSVLPIHVRRAWYLGKNRTTGLITKGMFLWLAATGYCLYYFSSDSNESWLPLLHWVIGLSLPLTLIVHIRRGRVRRGILPNPASREAALLIQPASPVSPGVASQPNSGSPERTPHVSPSSQARVARNPGQSVA